MADSAEDFSNAGEEPPAAAAVQSFVADLPEPGSQREMPPDSNSRIQLQAWNQIVVAHQNLVDLRIQPFHRKQVDYRIAAPRILVDFQIVVHLSSPGSQ